MRRAKFEFRKQSGDRGGYYWRLKARNGEIVATGEDYGSKSDAKLGAIDMAMSAVEAMAALVQADGS